MKNLIVAVFSSKFWKSIFCLKKKLTRVEKNNNPTTTFFIEADDQRGRLEYIFARVEKSEIAFFSQFSSLWKCQHLTFSQCNDRAEKVGLSLRLIEQSIITFFLQELLRLNFSKTLTQPLRNRSSKWLHNFRSFWSKLDVILILVNLQYATVNEHQLLSYCMKRIITVFTPELA